jgi:hypothetical protein
MLDRTVRGGLHQVEHGVAGLVADDVAEHPAQ